MCVYHCICSNVYMLLVLGVILVYWCVLYAYVCVCVCVCVECYIAAMDTTLDPQPVWSGKALFYKLQAEAFLQSTGLGFAIVKPCR